MFAISAERLSRSTISIELTLISNEILLSCSPDFSRNAIRPTQPVSCLVSDEECLRQVKQKILYAVRVDFNRSVEKQQNSLPKIDESRVWFTNSYFQLFESTRGWSFKLRNEF